VREGSACDGDCEFAGDIHVMNADGSGSTRLMKTRADDDEPSWTGDGQWIAFHSDRNALGSDLGEEPRTELYAIQPDGSCLTWLTNGTAFSRTPAYEPETGLSADPGGCGPSPRDPLVETDTREAESFTGFPIWWLGHVAPNNLLLTGSDVERDHVSFGYRDCGRFDPKECGAHLFINNADLCAGGRPLRYAGRRGWSLRLARGALLAEWREKGFRAFELFTGRTWLGITTDVGGPASAIDGLRRMGEEHAPGSAMPSARLPRSFWRQLTRVTTAHRRLKDVDAVAERLTLSRAEVKRRLTLARQLAELGVKHRLSCGR
jgi:hypothetical protein